MTPTTTNEHNDDNTMTAKSPNDRAKKKSREDPTSQNPDSMDYEIDEIEPRDLFNNNNNNTTSSGDVYDRPTPNDPTKEPDDEFSDANDDENDNDYDNDDDDEDDDAVQPAVDLTGDDSSLDDVANAPNPFLANVDLANTIIWNQPINDANDLWLSDPEWSVELPYTTEEINSDDFDLKDTLDYHVNLCLDYIAADEDSDDTSVSQWIYTIAHAFAVETDDQDDDIRDDFRIIRRMAIRLTLTDPFELFPPSSWKDGKLTMVEPSHRAWTACYCMFGAPWKNRTHWIAPAAQAKPNKPVKSKLKRKASDRSTASMGKSVDFRTDAPLQSSRAVPAQVSDRKSSMKSGTRQSILHNPYKATNTTTSGKTFIPNKSTEVSTSIEASAATPLAAAANTKSSSMYLRKALLSNPRHTAKVKGMKDVNRKYRTYVKIKFVKFNSDVTTEQAEELSSCFRSMMDRVWTIDSTVLVLAWKEGASSKPLRSRSEFPKSKEGLVGYVDNLWMQKGKSAYCRVLLSHDTPSDQLFNDHGLQSWLEEFDLSLVVDRIQAQRVTNTGHLLGYHALVCNVENLADAIQNQSAMANIQVEVRSEFIRFGIKKGTPRTNTKILNVYTAWASASRARRALVEIYSSMANGNYPLGVQARFIPNVNDTRFIRTTGLQLAHTNSLKKHIKFMTHTGMSSSYTIIELDHYNEELGMSLRQAIMHVFSANMENSTLFLAVDTSFYGDCVNFAYREELENEAITMISALPLFLYASLGRRSVWDWFTSDARHEASYYTWDMDRGIVPVNEMDVTNTKLTNWEQLDDDDEVEEEQLGDTIVQPFRLLLNETGDNGFNDNGTLRTQLYRDTTTRMSGSNDQDSTTTNNDDQTNASDGFPQMDVPSADSTETSTTPSTLTRTPDKDTLLEEMAADPDMVAKFEAMLKTRRQKAAQASNAAAPGTGGNGS